MNQSNVETEGSVDRGCSPAADKSDHAGDFLSDATAVFSASCRSMNAGNWTGMSSGANGLKVSRIEGSQVAAKKTQGRVRGVLSAFYKVILCK